MKHTFAELAHWDYNKLCAEMIALCEDSFDLDLAPDFSAFNETSFPINSPPNKAGKKPRKMARRAATPAARLEGQREKPEKGQLTQTEEKMTYRGPDTDDFPVVEGNAKAGQKLGEKPENTCDSDAMQQLREELEELCSPDTMQQLIEEIKRECGGPKCLLQEIQQEMNRPPVGALLAGDAGTEYPPA